MRTALIALSLLVVGCNTQPTREAEQSPAQAVAIAPGTPLAMSLEVSGEPADPTVIGTTNLPDGTSLFVEFENPQRLFGQEKVTVSGGKFVASNIMNGASLLPGKYNVLVSSPLADIQPPDVRAAVGTEYEYLTGPSFEDEAMGRTISYRQPYVVPGVATAEQRAAFKAGENRKLDDFAQRSCEERQIRHHRPTLTPKAQAEIADCKRNLLRDIKS